MSSQHHYSIEGLPSEAEVGKSLTIRATVPRPHKNAWIGFYLASVPSVPGVSCGRWALLPNDDSGDSGPDWQTVSVCFSPDKLPNHPGEFEARLHSGRFNNYKVRARQRIHFTRRPVSRTKRALFLLLLIAVVAFFQHLLNEKGVCSYQDPHGPDAFRDYLSELTSPLNRYLAANWHVAELVQALSSAALDATMLLLLCLAAVRRSTIRPFLALFVLMSLRFVAQSIATFPCPPGFIWPRGAVFGVAVPTLFVDYHPANDFFFSGHVGTIIVAAIEFAAMDYWKISLFQLLVVAPLITLMVVSFRVHRGTDVFAAIIASIAACAISERFVDAVDTLLIQAEELDRPRTKGDRPKRKVDQPKTKRT